MALSSDDIFGLELRVRQHADALRRAWPHDAADTPAVQAHARMMRDEAKAYDQIGDLLKGLRGCWDMGGADMVREGYKRESRAYDLSKTYVLTVVAEVPAQVEEVAA